MREIKAIFVRDGVGRHTVSVVHDTENVCLTIDAMDLFLTKDEARWLAEQLCPQVAPAEQSQPQEAAQEHDSEFGAAEMIDLRSAAFDGSGLREWRQAHGLNLE